MIRRPWLLPAPLPPPGTMRPLNRVRIFAEVMAAYAPLLVRLRGNDLRAMVAEARSPQRRRIPTAESERYDTARRLGSIVTRSLAVLPTDKRCLIRSLVTLRMLEHRSIDGRLVLGVRSQDGFSAHAWVECEGRPVLPIGDHRPLVDL